jgi:hypothetical protein
MARIVMFAYLDPSTDTRVRREARALIDAGHRVEVVGLHRGRRPDDLQWRDVDDMSMLLVASPRRWRDVADVVRYPWRTSGRRIAAVRRALARRGRGGHELAVALARALLVFGWSIVRLPVYLVAGEDGQSSPTPHSTGSFSGRSRSSGGRT